MSQGLREVTKRIVIEVPSIDFRIPTNRSAEDSGIGIDWGTWIWGLLPWGASSSAENIKFSTATIKIKSGTRYITVYSREVICRESR